jgi:hypothetical protein
MGHVWAGLCVVYLLGAPGSVPDLSSHVRATDKAARQVVASAIERSPTVAHLITQLNRSDVFVYVSVRGIDIPTAKTVLLASPGKLRYLHVLINVTQSPGQRLVLLGHELQHALEIANAPEVRDRATLAALFRKIGWTAGSPNKFETHLAQEVGARVRRDLVIRSGTP